jgi:hypothetical protein
MPQPPKRLTPSNGALDLFGSEVRRYRELAGRMSIADLADKIPYSPSFVGAIERAESGCERGFAEACDEVLETKQALAHLHDGLFAKKVGGLPEWFKAWPGVEESAVKLAVYQPLVIYGLLQTDAYANVLLGQNSAAVEARMKRQAILSREDPPPPRVVYVFPEHVLWVDKGGPAVMYEQLGRLIKPPSPHTSIQVVPGGVPHLGNDGAFVIATLADGTEAAYVETSARGIMLDSRADISRLKDVFTDICTQALPVGMSAELINRTNEERWKS